MTLGVSPAPPFLQASGLTKAFGTHVAVRDLSCELCRGEVVALLGPNGAGKTTTMRLLAGLLPPTSGAIRIDGVVQNEASWPRARGRIGLLTETPGVWDRLSVRVNLHVYAKLYGLADPSSRVAELLGRFDLAGRAEDPAGALSKGMRQKLALARALLHDPTLVLLDEPTAGLDPAMARRVRQLIGDLRAEGRAVFVSTHNLDEAERMADRVLVLRQTVLAFDSPAALRARLTARTLRITLAGPVEGFADVAASAGAVVRAAAGHVLVCDLTDVRRETPALVRALAASGAEILAVQPDEPGLEDAYLSVLEAT